MSSGQSHVFLFLILQVRRNSKSELEKEGDSRQMQVESGSESCNLAFTVKNHEKCIPVKNLKALNGPLFKLFAHTCPALRCLGKLSISFSSRIHTQHGVWRETLQ